MPIAGIPGLNLYLKIYRGNSSASKDYGAPIWMPIGGLGPLEWVLVAPVVSVGVMRAKYVEVGRILTPTPISVVLAEFVGYRSAFKGYHSP